MAFFTLVLLAAADVAVLRDGGVPLATSTVDAMGQIEKAADGLHVPDHPAARKQARDVEPAKAVARSHGEWTAGAVFAQAMLDPFALGCFILLVCYVAFHQLVPAVSPKLKAEVPAPKRESDVASVSSSNGKSQRSQKSKAPDRFALVVNQKLVRLDSVDEVLDFALQSAATGRTDIVNCVTAIHRSAKLVASKPQFERIRVGQDPRLLELLQQLQKFVDAGDCSPTILARAVGNTTWALAKLQFREDPEIQILDTLREVFVAHCQAFRPEELMNAVWAFAELRRDKDSDDGEHRVLAVAQAAVSCISKFPDFTLQQVVYLSWALARMSSIAAVKHSSSEVRAGLLDYTEQIAARARPDLTYLTTKNLAMLSWASASLHANLGLLDGEGSVSSLLSEIAEMIAQQGIAPFQPGEIASIVWALNKVHVREPTFFAAFETHLIKNGLRGYSTQDISTVLCAFAQTKSGSDSLYALLGAKVTAMSKDFNRSERSLVQWAYSQLPNVTPPKF